MNTSDHFPSHLEDSFDKDILMQRDAHFGGSFQVMLDYYRSNGRGVDGRFEIERMKELAEEENRLQQNLAPMFLGATDAEEIQKAREAYKKLRQIYESKSTKNPFPKLIADLILSEEEDIKNAVDAIVEQRSAIVPSLIDLLKSEEMYNPIYPGYGKTPFLAAECLGQIGDKRAIISLFETIGRGDFFEDDISLKALKMIGSPAKEFLLKVLQGKPVNEDNERAAIALLAFKDEEEVAKACFKFLSEIDLKKESSLATYLILGCEGIKDNQSQKELKKFSSRSDLPKELKNDFETIFREWDS